MNIPKDESLCFFDSGPRYPYLVRRCRKATASLPEALQEARLSSHKIAAHKLDRFLYENKRGPVTDTDAPTYRVKKGGRILEPIKEFTNPGKSKNKKLQKLIENAGLDEGLGDVDIEDDGRFLFEEAKFSATTIISHLGKLLDVVSILLKGPNQKKGIKEEKVHSENFDDSILLKQGDTDIIWKFSNYSLTSDFSSESALNQKFYPSEAIVDLLSITYDDLIKSTQYKHREWQTVAYRHVIGSAVKHSDSGIFSVPQTAMSGLYLKAEDPVVKPSKKHKHRLEQNSNVSMLRANASKDSGLTSDNDNAVPKSKDKQHQGKKISKQKTRLEKFNLLGKEDSKVKSLESPPDSTPPKGKKEKEENLEEVPAPPVTQATISFAISSRTCYEKGWVTQPSSLEDPEHQTLLLWARQRLQQAIKKRVLEEQDSLKRNLQEITRRYYGDAKRDILFNSKPGAHNALAARKDLLEKLGKRQLFMITLPDGTHNVFYPSGNLAVACVSCPNHSGHYVLVFSDDKTEKKLLAHFTPSGRGVCYHKNGQIAFISMAKFGCCQEEDGTLINKWKWTLHKMVPPLSFQLAPQIVFRCSNKSCMTLFINMSGECVKFTVGSKEGIADPKIQEMGSLMTMEKFTSNIAIQLSKSVPKKKEVPRRFRPRDKKPSDANESGGPKVPADVLEQRMKELEVKFPEERRELEMNTPYQLELKALQRKFKSTASDWLDHYRKATGMSSPMKYRKSKMRPHSCSAVTLPSTQLSGGTPSITQRLITHSRAPSAPPMPVGKSMSSVRSSKFYERPDSSAHAKRLGTSISGRRSVSPDRASQTSKPGSPFKCGLLQQPSKVTRTLPKEGCPLALRLELQGRQNVQCRCDNRKVPILTDIELDEYLSALPKTQLVVLSIVTSGSPSPPNPADSILEKMYRQTNRNRSIPCVQARHDAYRLMKYVIPPRGSAQPPLLKTRHNVVPGMFMMYQGGKLLFANYIFDGYGSTKKDLLKQITRTRKEALKGQHLPEDFRFTTNSILSRTSKTSGYDIGTGESGRESDEEDDLIEEISSEKVVSSNPLKLNIILSDELRNAMTSSMDTTSIASQRKTKSTLSKVSPVPASKVH